MSVSSDSSGSPIILNWDTFPITEFVLTLMEPAARVQWLPRAIANVLLGEGSYRFLLHRVGARQGPWEVLARVVTKQEGGTVV